ncbi:MAG: 2'-5' RNA ligase family protein [Leptolyngbyaceae cyanobacterium SL_7_1]|nr:2'-5' RNA ligase family protein [Leptolyngbyaceae cyanobacterium SL_7_1]
MASPVRFFIALVPPVEIQSYAEGVIRELGDRYHTRTAKAPPHVTLQPPFEWHLEERHRLIQCLAEFAHHAKAVPVNLVGFGAFAPRVLYINVVRTPGLLELQAALMAQLAAILAIVDPKSQQRPFAPHLTVASRNITRQTFRAAWEELRSRPVEFEFVGDRLVLLQHDGQRWQIHREFPLQPQG